MLALSKLRTCADAYVALGFAVFPIAADCRTPLIKGGCHAATNVPERVPHLFDRPANIALACGQRSGVFVLDVDRKGAFDGEVSLARLQADYDALPRSWEVCTPSGGRHIYFAQPAERKLRNRVNLKTVTAPNNEVRYEALDVRASGGSVALPPSGRADGLYRWSRSPSDGAVAEAPVWLLDVIDPPEPPRPPTPPLRLGSSDRAVRYACAVVDGEAGNLARMAANTGRNQRLFQAACRLGELIGGGLLPQDHAEAVLENAAVACGLVRDDGLRSVRASIRSGIARGLANPQRWEAA